MKIHLNYQRTNQLGLDVAQTDPQIENSPTSGAARENSMTEQARTKAPSKWSLDQLVNVGHVITEAAKRMPDAIAVAQPHKRKNKGKRPGDRLEYSTISFGELEKASNQIAAGIGQSGIEPGTRLALMVPPGIEFVAQVFGLFKAGVVVILIDPGMGRKNMIKCLAAAKPEGIVGIGRAQIARTIFSRRFPLCKNNIVVGHRRWWGCKSAEDFKKLPDDSFVPIQQTREQEAAIIFTTGSTGPPKGVLYRHRIFLEQAAQIRDYFGIEPGTVDVSGFPLFALFNCGMGTTTVFPEMDATRPAEVEPLFIKDAIDQFNADQSFGSPALWNTVSLYCEQQGLRLPSIKRILSAGAPVPPHVLKRIKSIISEEGEAFTPYGATESLPVACNSASEVLNETAAQTELGNGTCVGKKFPDIQWRIIEISDGPISDISQAKIMPQGAIGELMVQGAVVTDQYVTRTDANALHKVIDGDSFWHRMGDVGYFDTDGRFWFCGRKNHRVVTENGTLYSVACEGIINSHPHVYRSALVGVTRSNDTNESDTIKTPVIVVQPWPEHYPASDSLVKELTVLASEHEITKRINHFLVRETLPVDIRHNSKIFREQLAIWAEGKV